MAAVTRSSTASMQVHDDVEAAPRHEKGELRVTVDEKAQESATDIAEVFSPSGSELEKQQSTEDDGARVLPGVQTPAMRRKATMQFVTLCCSMFVAGWNDGTLGPLLPRIQEVYHVSLTIYALWFDPNLTYRLVMPWYL